MGVRKAKYRLEKWKIKTYDAKGKKVSPETEEKMRRHLPNRRIWKSR